MNDRQLDSKVLIDRIEALLKSQRAADSKAICAEVLYKYVGEVDFDKVQAIAVEVEEELIQRSVSKGSVKKAFNVLIEGLQNLIHHSFKVNGKDILGLQICRSEADDNIMIRIMGLSLSESVDGVIASVNELNTMDRPTIKAHYLDVMENGELSEKGGAGLGLITMVMKSKEGLTLTRFPLEPGLCLLDHFMVV